MSAHCLSAAFRQLRIPLAIYAVTLTVYAIASGPRLRHHSADNHYVYLADAFLHGRLALAVAPPHGNDWAQVEELTLADGRQVRGAFLQTGLSHRFRTTRGERLSIEPGDIRARRTVTYVSFPWFPALLMLPFVALWGLAVNDVLFTLLLAAANPVWIYLMLRRLAALGHSNRTLSEDLWLTGLFAFGTVHFYSSVLGQVWYTAHVVGVGLTILYVLAALEGRHPALAGLCLGLGLVTRTPIPFAFPLLLGEILRRHLTPPPPPITSASASESASANLLERARAAWPRILWRPAIADLGRAAIPATGVALVACTLNVLRFDDPFEFGHRYLTVRWTERIQRWGLFNYHFLSRNLAVMLTLLPRILPRAPFVQVSWHGLSLFFTTPLFACLLWPRRRHPLQPWLYASCLLPMILHLLYQNSGYVQFGYRFSLDYTVFLVALLAIGGYRLGTWARALILLSVAINAFGAVTFGRMWQFYFEEIFPVS